MTDRKEYRKQWCLKNKDKVKKNNDKYRKTHKDTIRKIMKKWYLNNKDKVLQTQKEYRENHKEKFKELTIIKWNKILDEIPEYVYKKERELYKQKEREEDEYLRSVLHTRNLLEEENDD